MVHCVQCTNSVAHGRYEYKHSNIHLSLTIETK